MAFKMMMSKETIQGKDVAPAGPYDLRLVAFNPKKTNDGRGVNFNPIFEIVNHPEYAGRKVFDSLSTNAGFMIEAFANAIGVPLETDGENYSLAGIWDKDQSKFKEDDPSTWTYDGPLLNRVLKAEVYVNNYNNRDSNKVKEYLPATN